MIVSGYRFDMDKANCLLEKMGAQKAILQLPDGLRYRSQVFIDALDVHIELWGGSCYGACDLPNSIGDADVLIHVGHSEIPNMETRYPVIYLEGHSTVELEVPDDFVERFVGKTVALYSTVQYIEQRDELAKILTEKDVTIVMGEGDDRIKYPGQVLGCNFSASVKADEHVFVGTGRFHPIGLSMSLKTAIHVLDPVTKKYLTTEGLNDKILRKRFAAITISQEKNSVAILVSNKIGQYRGKLADSLKERCQRCRIVYMDEIIPEKVDSLGFEVAINTACPRLALDDNIRFKTTMLTPQEFLISRKELDWADWEMDEIK